MHKNTRIVFMGTSEYAVPVLRALHENGYQIVLVVTQPDRRQGRNRKKGFPPVKKLAMDLGLDVFQPENIRKKDAFSHLKSAEPDLIITASYGQILRKKHIELPKHGILNVHASVLPQLRGAAPIQFSIIRGHHSTGVTIMKTDVGIDTGPIVSKKQINILSDDTAGSLEDKLAQLGAELMLETLPDYLSGQIEPVEQDHELSTHAPRLLAEDGLINWDNSAEKIALQVRGMNPCPGAYTTCNGQRLKIHFASPDNLEDTVEKPGTVVGLRKGKGLQVQTGDGVLLIEILQPACKKQMPAISLIQGRYIAIGYAFGCEETDGARPCHDKTEDLRSCQE